MARYFKGTCTGITGPIYVSAELVAELVKYEDPDDDKIKLAAVRGKAVNMEVRTEQDPTSLAGTIASNVAMVFLDASGGVSDLTFTFPKVGWKQCKIETGQEDTKPGQFSMQAEAEWPTIT